MTYPPNSCTGIYASNDIRGRIIMIHVHFRGRLPVRPAGIGRHSVIRRNPGDFVRADGAGGDESGRRQNAWQQSRRDDVVVMRPGAFR